MVKQLLNLAIAGHYLFSLLYMYCNDILQSIQKFRHITFLFPTVKENKTIN